LNYGCQHWKYYYSYCCPFADSLEWGKANSQAGPGNSAALTESVEFDDNPHEGIEKNVDGAEEHYELEDDFHVQHKQVADVSGNGQIRMARGKKDGIQCHPSAAANGNECMGKQIPEAIDLIISDGGEWITVIFGIIFFRCALPQPTSMASKRKAADPQRSRPSRFGRP
jgi:hypothetical protein